MHKCKNITNSDTYSCKDKSITVIWNMSLWKIREIGMPYVYTLQEWLTSCCLSHPILVLTANHILSMSYQMNCCLVPIHANSSSIPDKEVKKWNDDWCEEKSKLKFGILGAPFW